MIPSLCEYCRYLKEVVSGKGSRFLLCQKSGLDNRYAKYPPQPVIHCFAFELIEDHNHETPQDGVEFKGPSE